MRYREQNNMTQDLTFINVATDGNTNEDTTFTAEGLDLLGDFKSMHDVSRSDYVTRAAKGEIFVNPMSSYKHERSASATTLKLFADVGSPYLWKSHQTGGAPHLTIGGLVEHLAVSIDHHNLSVLAGTEAYANINSPDFQGAVWVAELRESIQLLTNPFGSINKLVKRYAKKGRQKAKRNPGRYKNYSVVDFIEENWLQYRYGIMPLVYDAQDITKAMSNLASEMPERQTARGSASDEGEESQVIEYVNGGYEIAFEKEIKTKRSIDIRAGVLYQNNFTRNSFGVRLEDIPSAVWETVPFSFVADWFVNVGDYIQAITPKLGIDILGSWTVNRDTQVTTGKGSTIGPVGSVWEVSLGNTSSEEYKSLTTHRTPEVSVGIAYHPSPYKGTLGKKRLLDTLSLTDQILKSKLR